jgi:GTP-binding protein
MEKNHLFLQQTNFFDTTNKLNHLPKSPKNEEGTILLPEIAFVGRSNAGKSTAINTLCQKRQMAFSSKTPGRTQHLNFFLLQDKKVEKGFLVDLPGYGFAKVGGQTLDHWDGFLGKYLHEREELSALFLMMDCRHPFTNYDIDFLEWFSETEKPIHILLTKCDKLTFQEQKKCLQSDLVKQAYELLEPINGSIQLFSALKGTGLNEAREKVVNIITTANNQNPVGLIKTIREDEKVKEIEVVKKRPKKSDYSPYKKK